MRTRSSSCLSVERSQDLRPLSAPIIILSLVRNHAIFQFPPLKPGFEGKLYYVYIRLFASRTRVGCVFLRFVRIRRCTPSDSIRQTEIHSNDMYRVCKLFFKDFRENDRNVCTKDSPGFFNRPKFIEPDWEKKLYRISFRISLVGLSRANPISRDINFGTMDFSESSGPVCIRAIDARAPKNQE